MGDVTAAPPPVKWAILGSGAVADGFAHDLRRIPDAELTAIASRRRSTATDFAARHGVARIHDTYAELVADPDVDVVYVATPNDRHAADCVSCLEHGKAVLCEKPFTVDARQAHEVVAAARAHDLFCMEAMWMRFVPAVRRAVELVRAGAIGDVRNLHADFSSPAVVDPTSRLFDPARGGGALLDLGVYTLSLAQLLLGEPHSVAGHLDVGSTSVDEQAAVVLGYDSGATAVLTSSLRTRGPNRATIGGTTGTIELNGPICAPTRLTLSQFSVAPGGGAGRSLRDVVRSHPFLARGARAGRAALRRVRGSRTTRFPVEGHGYAHEILEVHECLRAGRTESRAMPLDESVRLMELIDRIRAA